MPVKLVPGPDATTCPHTVIKVGRLSAGETWVLDTTGCQYGFREVLSPFNKYIEEKGCLGNMAKPVPYDATETKDLDYFATLPFMNKFRTQRENMKQERRSRLRFAEFVNGASVSQDLLNGSKDDFEGKLDRFAAELKLHMES